MLDQVDTVGGICFYSDGYPADMHRPATTGTAWSPGGGIEDPLAVEAASSGEARFAKIEVQTSRNIRNRGDNS